MSNNILVRDCNTIEEAAALVEDGLLNNVFNSVSICMDYSEDVIDYLITRGLDIHLGLYGACRARRFELCKKLLALGANSSDSCLSAAHKERKLDCIEFILDHGNNIPLNKLNHIIKYVSREGTLDLVKKLINAGADHYERGMMGAEMGGRTEIIEYYRTLIQNKK